MPAMSGIRIPDPFPADGPGLRLLLLGGTVEARLVAQELRELPGIQVLTSLAGRNPGAPLPPGPVRVGGFGGEQGLADFLAGTGVGAVLDATHPFAQRITAHAALACHRAQVPLLVLRRPAWTPVPGDRWVRVPDLSAAAATAAALEPGTVLLTTGRTGLHLFATDPHHHYLARVLDPAQEGGPPGIELIARNGADGVDDEVALFRRHEVCALVTKDSGGPATAAKLHAARRLALLVILVDRPPLPPQVTVVDSAPDALAWIRGLLEHRP